MERPRTEYHDQIETVAAGWLARRDADGWTDADQAELMNWLEVSTAHLVAFLRLEAAWQRTDRLKSLGAGIARGVVPAPDAWQLAPASYAADVSADTVGTQAAREISGRARFMRFGVAACMCAVLLLAIAFHQGYFEDFQTFRTPVGGIAYVPTEDGSTITLNTDSEVRVAFRRSERNVRLDHGEAYFEVAKDRDRPFIVSSNGYRLIAVGTAFSVRRDPDGSIRVAVTEGRVRIESDAVRGSAAAPVELASAGSLAWIHDGRIEMQSRPLSELQETLSWRIGYLVFHDVPLPEAVEEFNRYNLRKIQVADAKLAEIRLSGRFQATQYRAFVRLLEDGFPIRAENYDDRVVLTAR